MGRDGEGEREGGYKGGEEREEEEKGGGMHVGAREGLCGKGGKGLGTARELESGPTLVRCVVVTPVTDTRYLPRLITAIPQNGHLISIESDRTIFQPTIPTPWSIEDAFYQMKLKSLSACKRVPLSSRYP